MEYGMDGFNNSLSFIEVNEQEQQEFNEYMERIQDDEYYTRLYEDNSV